MSAFTDVDIKGLLSEFADLRTSMAAGTATKSDKKKKAKLEAKLKEWDAKLTSAPPDWDSLPIQTATVWIPKLPKTKDDLQTQRPPVKASGTSQIKIAKYPFARGMVRVAYHAQILKDDGSWQPYIAKEFIETKNCTREMYLDSWRTVA